jgi:type I restriction enzyme, S subunit
MLWPQVPLWAVSTEAQTGPFGSQLHSDEYVENETPLINPSNIMDGKIVPNQAVTVDEPTARRLSRHRLTPGDLLFARRGELGRAAVVTQEAAGWLCGTGSLRVRLRPGTFDAGFTAYVLQSAATRSYFELVAVGTTMDNLNTAIVMGLPVPLPPKQDQLRIAAFLDAQAARIDALIARKRHLIDLIDERQVSLAHDMISGQNIAGQRRDSGVGWLGDLLDTWPLAPVGSQFHVKLGRMLNQDRATSGDMRPYIRNINVRWDVIDVHDIAEMDFPSADRAQYRLRQGDLLVNEGGAGIGRSAIWNDEIAECYFQKSVLRLRPIRDCSQDWMIECMRVAVAKKVFLVEGNLATIPHVPAEALRAFRFPFPARKVQDQLLPRLRENRKRDHQLRSATLSQIALLQERRQALITAAVTGEMEIPEGVAG